MTKRKFHGWVREWGRAWRIECTGSTEEAARRDLEREFGGEKYSHVSTLVLEEGERPYIDNPVAS